MNLEHTILAGGRVNVTSGAFERGFASPPAVGTVMVSLRDTLKNNVVTRTWTATGNGGLGFGCSVAGLGNFTMTKTESPAIRKEVVCEKSAISIIEGPSFSVALYHMSRGKSHVEFPQAVPFSKILCLARVFRLSTADRLFSANGIFRG
jgi:hypothetical protein